MERFKGSNAIVTGGGTGIGFACAARLASEGATVTLVGRRKDVLEQAAGRLGAGASWVSCDVEDPEAVDRAVHTAVERGGPLRAAVNAAGGGMSGSVMATPQAIFEAVVRTNLGGTNNSLRSEALAMKAGGGAIVNISSLASQRTSRWQAAYGAAKAGVNTLTIAAADELCDFGIRVNAILPGLVRTETAAPIADMPEGRKRFLEQIPMGRLGQPEEIASFCAFLLSDEAAWVTGQCIAVDGGQSIRRLPDLGDVYRQFLPDLFLPDEGRTPSERGGPPADAE